MASVDVASAASADAATRSLLAAWSPPKFLSFAAKFMPFSPEPPKENAEALNRSGVPALEIGNRLQWSLSPDRK
ncbi:hypothetical protein NB311A_09326 [Nitrobacter sp. Nb-311A]|nr:hypothetical protein NB311A_09326 [Nitrobacter sp. Nb-311A]